MPKQNSGGAGWFTSGVTWGIAGGIALGALVVAPAMAPIANNSFNNIGGSSTPEGEQKDKGRADNREANAANALLAQSSTRIVDGTLTGRPYLIIRTPDANDDDVSTTSWLAEMAGGTKAGQITLTDKFLSQDGADELRSIIANTLPAGALLSVDNQAPGIHAGESLGAALMFDQATGAPLATVEERAVVLQTLREAGFIEYEDGTITPAQGIIVATGEAEGGDEFASNVLADLGRGLDSRGDSVVLAGRRGAAEDKGPIAVVRDDPKANENISTVDSLESETGRISAVLALAEQINGGSGSYGSADNAQAPAPERG